MTPTPRHGDKAYCAECGKRIRFIKTGWFHAKAALTPHRAVPREKLNGTKERERT
jgi:hypothetical protein